MFVSQSVVLRKASRSSLGLVLRAFTPLCMHHFSACANENEFLFMLLVAKHLFGEAFVFSEYVVKLWTTE